MADSNTRIVLVVCNDYGELALALYLLANQSFAENATLMLPPGLHAKNPDVLPGRTIVYHSLNDVREELNGLTPGILGLFSGYLLPIHRLCSTEELGALLDGVQVQGWKTFTSDPFLGLLGEVEPVDLIQLKAPKLHLIWAIAASNEKKRLSHLLTESHSLLGDTLHVYPCGDTPKATDPEFSKRLHIHNGTYAAPSEPEAGVSGESSRWLFVLGDQDYTVQLGKHGRLSRKFPKLLMRKLHETLEAGRLPTLIAPSKVIDTVRKRSPASDSMELLSHCDYLTFQSLLTDAEFVFYWNAVSFTCIQRTLAGKPWFTFDDGHLLRGMNSDYASRITEWFFRGDEPPRLDINAKLTVDALQQATQAYLKPAWRARHALMASPEPEALFSALDPERAVKEANALIEAFELLQQLGKIISANALDGSFVVDTALLSYPKNGFKSAVMLVAERGTKDQEEFARSLAPTLAFFQPSVGAGRQEMDALTEDGKTWRSAVEAEMRAIVKGLPA